MTLRSLVLATVVAMVATGCASGGSPDDASGAETGDVPPAPSSTVVQPPTATPAERSWVEREEEWIAEQRRLVAVIQTAVDIGRRRVDPHSRELARRAMVKLGRCRFGHNSDPPTTRTALINDTLAKACGRLNQASLAASGYLLVEDPLNDIKAAKKDWREDSAVALELLASAAEDLEALTRAV